MDCENSNKGDGDETIAWRIIIKGKKEKGKQANVYLKQ